MCPRRVPFCLHNLLFAQPFSRPYPPASLLRILIAFRHALSLFSTTSSEHRPGLPQVLPFLIHLLFLTLLVRPCHAPQHRLPFRTLISLLPMDVKRKFRPLMVLCLDAVLAYMSLTYIAKILSNRVPTQGSMPQLTERSSLPCTSVCTRSFSKPGTRLSFQTASHHYSKSASS